MFSKLCFEQQGQGKDIPKGLSAVLCNQKTVTAKHQRHMHECNTRRAAKAPLGLLLLFVWSGCFSKHIACCVRFDLEIFLLPEDKCHFLVSKVFALLHRAWQRCTLLYTPDKCMHQVSYSHFSNKQAQGGRLNDGHVFMRGGREKKWHQWLSRLREGTGPIR